MSVTDPTRPGAYDIPTWAAARPHEVSTRTVSDAASDPLCSARGLVYGCAAGAVLWLAIYLVYWLAS